MNIALDFTSVFSTAVSATNSIGETAVIVPETLHENVEDNSWLSNQLLACNAKCDESHFENAEVKAALICFAVEVIKFIPNFNQLFIIVHI